MDMVVNAGKSRKNVEAYVLLPPDARRAIYLLIDTQAHVGVPQSNVFIFARMNSDTPMACHRITPMACHRITGVGLDM